MKHAKRRDDQPNTQTDCCVRQYQYGPSSACKTHPNAGETLPGEAFYTIPGGKGANQAVAVSRMGGQVIMVGRVGRDAFGQQMLDNLSDHGVDTTCITQDASQPTGIASIVVDENGQNRIIIVAGANGQVDHRDLERSKEAMGKARMLII